jgi:hypothetical protein
MSRSQRQIELKQRVKVKSGEGAFAGWQGVVVDRAGGDPQDPHPTAERPVYVRFHTGSKPPWRYAWFLPEQLHPA